jgi:phosphoribosylanthranilate isomerase
MSRTKIKLCGLTRMQDIEYVNEALPDYIGLVFAKSRRQVDLETAAKLKNALNRSIKAVGVFVNENINVVIDLCNNGIIDFIQLHGDEDEEYILKLRSQVNKPIIKAVRVENSDSLEVAQKLQSDYLLLDAYSAKEYGGTGKTFNWNFIKCIHKPFFLAGGIHIDNVRLAMKKTKPYCLDISSGVETNGLKDRNKIMQLVNKIRSVE